MLHLALDAVRYLRENAIIDPDGSAVSYNRLAVRVDQIAALLADQAIGRGELVAIVQNKSAAAFAAILAVLASGAAYLPLSPRWPRARLEQVLDDYGIEAILVDRAACEVGAWPANRKSARIIGVDMAGGHAVVVRGGAGDRVPYRDPDAALTRVAAIDRADTDVAYVIYTSGSSGRPKAVQIRHDSLAAFLGAVVRRNGYDASLRWLSVAPLHFDASTLDFLPLAVGGTLVLLDRVLLPGDILNALEGHRITHTMLISSLVRWLVGPRADLAARDLRHLRELWYGGEPCPTAILRRIKQWHPHLRFLHGYGPSEVCNTATFHGFADIPADAPEYMPVGRPLETVEAYLLDQDGKPVAPGEAGELWLGGVQVMAGYRGDEARTRAVLRENTFNPASPRPLYRTGDRMTTDADGNFVFLGRTDDLVKVNGTLVSLIEIQQTLIQALPVDDAIVVPATTADGDSAIEAFLVAGAAAIDRAAVAATLRRTLPPAFMPRAIHIVAGADVPRRDTGKVDVAALKRRFESASPAEPRTPETDETIDEVAR